MGDTKFCLHWKDFDTNMTKALKDLREENDFFDVTIACEDNQIQAHKVILSACSTFFRNILRRHPHQHPLLYLKGVKYKQLLDILDFMYNGEVNVVQEELKQFLAVAADLRVQGLTQKMNIPTIPTSIPTIKPSIPTIPGSIPNIQARKATVTEQSKIALQKHEPPTASQKTQDPPDIQELSSPVSTKQVVKESPKKQLSVRKVPQPVISRKIKPEVPPPTTMILEKCILEADIPKEPGPETIKPPSAIQHSSSTDHITPAKGK